VPHKDLVIPSETAFPAWDPHEPLQNFKKMRYLLSISMSPRGAAGGLISSREGPGASPGVFRFSGGSTDPRPCFFFYTHV